MRPTTPEGIRAEAEELAKGDIERHIKHGHDLNVFSTPGGRNDWQLGYDNAEPRSWARSVEYDTFYQRGRATARLIAEMILKADEIGFEIVKATESDYYMFKAKFWIEDSPTTFDTPVAAAQAVIDLHGEPK